MTDDAGYAVDGMFMRNWDERDETGFCNADEDMADVQRICERLKIPFTEHNFVKEYWNDVFTYVDCVRNGDALIADASEMVAGYERGLTPNPDILCNLRIKFGTFITRAAASKHSYIATGHYAQTEHHSAQEASLLRSVDEAKDQTYFLAGLAPGTLSRVCFPVGHLHKASVRMIAELEGFVSTAQRKESMGICFIGKRQFPEFIREYIAPSAGDIVDLDRRPIARHAGLYTYTLGQGANIPSLPQRYFVVGKDLEANQLVVAPGQHSTHLQASTVYLSDIMWSVSQPPIFPFGCQVRVRHRQPLQTAMLSRYNPPSSAPASLSAVGFVPWRPQQPISAARYALALAQSVRAATPGQHAALYDGSRCIGGATIVGSEA